MRPVILVSGMNGQLGQELKAEAAQFPAFECVFHGKDTLDIANESSLAACFAQCRPAFFINTAAYTAVDKAETDQEAAYRVNAAAPGQIAALCRQYGTRLIHVSTDYVFDGTGSVPYRETDATNPVNYYGYTKLVGEQLALANNPATVVLRTSWVYSIFGHNFVKTMLRLMQQRSEISVVDDQAGSPTYAADLAEAIMQIVVQTENRYDAFVPGVYHFSNAGAITWYQFAMAIREIRQFACTVHPIPTSQYPTPARRPAYSVMNKDKIQSVFGIALHDWKDSLQRCLQLM